MNVKTYPLSWQNLWLTAMVAVLMSVGGAILPSQVVLAQCQNPDTEDPCNGCAPFDSDELNFIDFMHVYDDVTDYEVARRGFEAKIQSLNLVFYNSNVPVTARAIHTHQVDWVEHTYYNEEYTGFQRSATNTEGGQDDVFADLNSVHDIREELKADIIVGGTADGYHGSFKIPTKNNICNGNIQKGTGEQYVMGQMWSAGKIDAFSHEMGHGLGCCHSASGQGGCPANDDPDTFSSVREGYQFFGNNGNYGTVTHADHGDPFLGDPNIYYDGVATGTAIENCAETVRIAQKYITHYRLSEFPGDVSLTTRGSISNVGNEANNDSFNGKLSADGRYLVFASDATNLGSGLETDVVRDIYLRDRTLGTTVRVSNGLAGVPDGHSGQPAISSDGKFIAYHSSATNLVNNDTNGKQDIFLYNVDAGTTIRISQSAPGVGGNGDSSRPVVTHYDSDNDGTRDKVAVAFDSLATNLLAVDTNAAADVYLYDGGSLELISVSTTGQHIDDKASLNAAISENADHIAFETVAAFDSADLGTDSDIYARNRTNDETVFISAIRTGNNSLSEGNGESFKPSISSTGQYIAYETYATNLGDDSTYLDVVWHDRDQDGNGVWDYASMSSGDKTQTINASDVYGHEFNHDDWEPVGDSTGASISGDGMLVVYKSVAANIVPWEDSNNKADVFIWEKLGATKRISVDSNEAQALGGASFAPTISANGKHVAFTSAATNLVGSDTNAKKDIFVRTLRPRDADIDDITVVTGTLNSVAGEEKNDLRHPDRKYFVVDSVTVGSEPTAVAEFELQVFEEGLDQNNLNEFKVLLEARITQDSNEASVPQQTVKIWNYDTSAWVDLFGGQQNAYQEPNQLATESFQLYKENLTNAGQYIDTDGSIRVRIELVRTVSNIPFELFVNWMDVLTS